MSEKTNSTTNNKRIAKNTMMLYVRMLFSMAVAFYTSRVILSTLGIEDFGINNVVGGVAAMFSFLNSSLSGATSRFLIYHLGEGNMQKMREVFSAAWTVHLLLATIIFVLCETVGLWLLETQLVIPTERMNAARVLFQLSIISTVVSITQVPFTSVVIAHEHMDVYAYISILEVVLKLCIVFMITLIPFDKLIVYGCLYFSVNVFVLIVNRAYAFHKFKECNNKISRDKSQIVPMLKFSGWDLYGNMSVMARTQGVNILQNMFFGPVVNAATGISNQVMGGVLSFSNSFITAIRPQIIKNYAQQKISEMQLLAERGARLAFFLMFFVSFPCFLELPLVLDLWLEEVPEYTCIFVRLSIMYHWLVIMFFPMSAIIHATGRMKRISLLNGTLYLLVIPLAFIGYNFLNLSPVLPFILNAALAFIGCLINLQTVKMYVSDFRALHYLTHAFLRGVVTAAIASVIPIAAYYVFDANWTTFFIVCLLCVISCILSYMYIGLDKHERVVIVSAIAKKLHLKK